MLFELGLSNQSASVSRPSVQELSTSTLARIAQCAAHSATLINIVDLTDWLNEHPDICDDREAECIQNVLCMPIVNGQKQVIGVTQLINKVNHKI